MNVRQRVTRKSKMRSKALTYRQTFWSDVQDEDLWDRQVQDGWVTTPRTMPIIMNIIDALTKGASAGYTFFCLWSRSIDERIVEIQNATDLAAESGFSGERAVYTWRKRMQSLVDLGFIKAQKGTHDYQIILLLNPHKVIKNKRGEVQENLYAQLLSRGLEIGAKDFHIGEGIEED